jgi:hypothetical protein
VDRSTRQAAIWATAVSLPLAVLVLLFLFSRINGPGPSDGPTAAPAPHPTTPVEMAAPALTPRAAMVCRALLSRLPASIDGRVQRPVTAGIEQNAAYGDPPITVSCGVAPTTYPLTDEVWSALDVCWHLSSAPAGGAVWETVDREVPIRVTIPKAYDPQVATAFAAPIVATVKRLADPPSGCG